jgi:hypothetical protein
MVGNMLFMGQPGGSTAVLIDPWYILTAKHVLASGVMSDHTFRLNLVDGQKDYKLTAMFLHPTADLAVGRLDRSARLPGYPLYTGTQEGGQAGIIVGYGISGVGGPDANYPRGTKRSGYNRIDAVYYDPDFCLDYLLMDFDGPNAPGPYPPGTLGLDKEVLFAPGDSGGPTFIDIGGTLYVAGIHHSLTEGNQDNRIPDYTDVGWDVRVRTYAQWIASQISPLANLNLYAVNASWGHVSVSPEPTDPNRPQFPFGMQVTLKALPEPNHLFSGWEFPDPNFPGDSNHVIVDPNTTLRIVMNGDQDVVAAFQCANNGLAPMLALSLACLLAARFRY